MIYLNSNQNPLGPSPNAMAAIKAALSECHHYPDSQASELKNKLAERHSVLPEQVLIGAGSTELISIIARSLLGRGETAITSELSFVVYSTAARAAGGQLVQVPMRQHGFDLEALAAAANGSTQITFLANPNNPTGTVFDARRADDFLARVPEHVTVIFDEAYYEYAEAFARERKLAYSHSLDYVRQRRNVIVLRTFSKVYGLAGLRIAYALGPPALLARFARVRSVYSISGPAQAAAVAALDDQVHVRETLANNRAGAKWLGEELSGLGFNPLPTWANFLYMETAGNGEMFAERLKGEGVAVRPLADWGAPKAIRVTIGTPEQNRALLAALRKILRQ